jgi:hypothetical protein
LPVSSLEILYFAFLKKGMNCHSEALNHLLGRQAQIGSQNIVRFLAFVSQSLSYEAPLLVAGVNP